MKYIIAACMLLSVSFVDAQIVWQKVSTLPDKPRVGFAGFLIDDKYYMVGGVDTNGLVLSDNWEYNIVSNQWAKKGVAPFRRLADCTGSSSIYGYVMDGIDSNINLNPTSWKYNPQNDVWLSIRNAPVPKNGACSFFYGTSVYTCFGADSTANPSRSIWRYDTLFNTWQEKTSLSGLGRYIATSIVVDSFAYIVGGRDSNYKCINEIWRYDILHDKWDSLPKIPADSGREFASIFGFKNFLLVCFGIYQNATANVVFVPQTTIYKFDFASGQWSQINYSGTVSPSGGGGYFQYGGKCYMYGGQESAFGASLYNDLWMFDPAPLHPVYDDIEEIRPTTYLKIYPNPVGQNQSFTIETDQAANVTYYNLLGQALYSSTLDIGYNTFNFSQIGCASDILIYKVVLHDGKSINGKISLIK